jgi:hypothetical protein
LPFFAIDSFSFTNTISASSRAMVTGTPTVLLMDPFRSRDEAEREAAAVGGWGRNSLAPPQDWCHRTEYLPGLDSPSPGQNNS